jgi:hypothetical protein
VLDYNNKKIGFGIKKINNYGARIQGFDPSPFIE